MTDGRVAAGKVAVCWSLDFSSTTLYIHRYIVEYMYIITYIEGYAVAQLVEALRYKPEGRGFNSL
jgi:hypothetical protein